MAFPEYVPTRVVTVGGAISVEDADSLLRVAVEIRSSHSLIWDATGYRFEKTGKAAISELGTEVSVVLPRTDVDGWKDASTGAYIDVSEPDSYTHRYTAVIRFINQDGRTIGTTYTVGPFVLPAGTGAVDLDKMVPASSVPGGQVSIPDVWGQMVAAAEAAAVSAQAALVDSDAFVAAQILDPESETGIASRATIAAAIGENAPPRVLASESSVTGRLANILDFGRGEERVAIAGTSLLNDPNDMPWKFLLRYAQLCQGTDIGVRQKEFNTTTQDYGSWRVAKTGTETPATGGVVMSDNFNRVAADLVGSTSSGGQVWGGTAGKWSADGAGAKVTSASSAPLSFNAGTPNAKLTTEFDLITQSTGAAFAVRLYAGAAGPNTLATDRAVFVNLNVTGAGVATLDVWKRIAATNRILVATDNATGLVNNSATTQRCILTLEISIQNVTATLKVGAAAPKVYTATITETDYAALSTYAAIMAMDTSGNRFLFDDISIETPSTPASYNGVEFWNAAVGGSNLSYQQSRISTMFPSGTSFGSLMVEGGANRGTASPAEYVAELDAFITAYKAAHPETTRILISSEPPQFPPSTTVAANALRQSAARDYAMANGYEYLAAYEAFAAQPDGGASLSIPGDGVHITFPDYPNNSSGINKLTWSGSVLWAAVMVQAMNAKRVKTAPPLTALP